MEPRRRRGRRGRRRRWRWRRRGEGENLVLVGYRRCLPVMSDVSTIYSPALFGPWSTGCLAQSCQFDPITVSLHIASIHQSNWCFFSSPPPPPLSLSSYFSLYLVLSFSMSVSVSVCSFCYCQSSFRAVSERFEFLKWSVMVAALKPALGCRQEAHLITNLSFQYRVQDSILKTEIQSNFKSKQRREDQLMMFALLVSVRSL